MRSVPLAVISIFILILAKEKTQPYFITILMTLPVVFEGLITATNEIGHEIIDEMRLLKGSIFIKIRKIYIPIIFPYIMMTIIQALGMSFKVLIMGEYLCYTNVSIGKNLYDLKALGMAGLLAYGILIVVIVSILEFMIWLIKIKVIYQRNSLRFNKKF
jgi:ABC transporter, permease protein